MRVCVCEKGKELKTIKSQTGQKVLKHPIVDMNKVPS